MWGFATFLRFCLVISLYSRVPQTYCNMFWNISNNHSKVLHIPWYFCFDSVVTSLCFQREVQEKEEAEQVRLEQMRKEQEEEKEVRRTSIHTQLYSCLDYLNWHSNFISARLNSDMFLPVHIVLIFFKSCSCFTVWIQLVCGFAKVCQSVK